MASKNATTTTTSKAAAAPAGVAATTNATTGIGPSVDETGAAVSTVPTGDGDTATIRDDVLNTVEDPKTANGDVVRKEAGISASATAEQILANGGVDTTDHTLAQTNRPDVPAQPPADAVTASASGAPTDVRVLADVTIAGQRYLPNDVIEGLPASLVKQHADSVDDAAAAVEYALSLGVEPKPYKAD